MKNPSLFCTVGIKSYEGEERKQDQIYQLPPKELLQNKDVIYLIDDICDTGKTLLNLKENMLHLNVISISLVYKKNELHKPDYYGFEHSDDRWVVFPWKAINNITIFSVFTPPLLPRPSYEKHK